jgi:hypothetical protein
VGNAKHDIGENDVVVLRERVGDWPAGTKGTAVRIYDDAALVEVSENGPTGRALDMFVVPADRLGVTWRVGEPPAPPMEA